MTQRPDKLPARRSCRTAQIVLCLVVFLSGGIIGIAATVIFPQITKVFQPPEPSDRIERYVRRLGDRLDLDNRQKEQLRPIIEERMKAFTTAFDSIRPQMLDNFNKMDQQIRPLLTAEQLPLWEEYFKERMGRLTADNASTQPATQP